MDGRQRLNEGYYLHIQGKVRENGRSGKVGGGWDNQRVRDDVTRRSNKWGWGWEREISQNLTHLAKTGRWNRYDSNATQLPTHHT